MLQNLQPYSIASEQSSLFSSVQILKNMLQRGKPTIASRQLRRAFGIGVAESGIDTPALALISNKPVVWSRLIRGDEKRENYPAKRFFDKLFPQHLEEYGFVKKLTCPEVPISKMTQIHADQFQDKKEQVDFFIPQLGLIIEIDGAQHEQKSNKSKDARRDAFTAKKLGLKTVRFTTQEVASENSIFLQKMEEIRSRVELVDRLEAEGKLNPPNGIKLRDYQKVFADGADPSDPRMRLTAAIRFQLLLLELLENGILRLGRPRKLLLVNRDGIDFARAAFEDLNELLANLLQLQGVSKESLDLEIEELDELPKNRSGSDLVVDFSILERFDDTFQVNHDVIYCRTHYFDFYRHIPKGDAVSIEASELIDYDFFRMSFADPIEYDLDLRPDSPQRESLRYFLRNLFLPFLDDVDFRDGQVHIVGSALSRHGTIGLLPTGSGKSICYQLAAVLQPAVSFVVCPIKSLMYDQKSDLDSIGFTRTNYITGDLKGDEKERIQRDFGLGRYFLVFISPERFQIHGFREEMRAVGPNLAYAVIDEAHCLSEWGHDFRTSYLNLANTIGRLAPNAIYIGLTATASANVLTDIQKEFNIPNDYVRTPLNFTRKELSFHVIDDKGRKENALIKLVAKMEEKWNGGDENPNKAGVVFTPVVNGDKGCYSLQSILSSQLGMDVRFFSGSTPKKCGMKGDVFETYKREVQEDFKHDKYRLLTATKAFGMGVNKGNIAYTVHFGIPSSMEALYQEGGRAGRDKRLFKNSSADCYVLLTKEPNAALLDKIWDSSTNIKDLKEQVDGLARDSDVSTNLFLMTNQLDTINDECSLIRRIYDRLKNTDDQQKTTLVARKFGSTKPKFEKAIYRLLQLGVVSDWLIEDFFSGVFQVEFQCLTETQLKENVERTIRKYEPKFIFDDVFASENRYYRIICRKLDNKDIDETQFIFLVLLLWSYDHFVYNRRQSLKTVYEQCGDLADGKIGEKEFKDRLEGYFKFDASSSRLLNLLDTADTDLWLTVFFENSAGLSGKQIISKKGLLTLREQISRLLESYKDNACLNYLSGVIRLISDQFDDADGERRMSSSFDRLIKEDRRNDAVNVVMQTLHLRSLLSPDARSRFARLVHEKLDDMSLLELVNEEFEDPYSYCKLLEPLVSRLENLTNRYKEINW